MMMVAFFPGFWKEYLCSFTIRNNIWHRFLADKLIIIVFWDLKNVCCFIKKICRYWNDHMINLILWIPFMSFVTLNQTWSRFFLFFKKHTARFHSMHIFSGVKWSSFDYICLILIPRFYSPYRICWKCIISFPILWKILYNVGMIYISWKHGRSHLENHLGFIFPLWKDI